MNKAVQATCRECASGYAGEHAETCRFFTGKRRPYLAPLIPCDFCAMTFYSTATKERQPFDAEDHIRKPTSMYAKVKGQPCGRCGDNSPKGTWSDKIAWPEHFVLGETATIKLPLYRPCPARQALHAARAAAPKKRRTKLQLVA